MTRTVLLLASLAACHRGAEPSESPPHFPSLPAEPPPQLRLVTPSDRFPNMVPVVSVGWSVIGWTGDGYEQVDVWGDGTIRLDGHGCDHKRRGQVSVARVTALLEALAKGGFPAFHLRCKHPHRDGDSFSLMVRIGRVTHLVGQPSCHDGRPHFDAARALVATVTGPNPCAAFAQIDDPVVTQYSPEAAEAALAKLPTCDRRSFCSATQTLLGFGASAAPELIAYVTEPSHAIRHQLIAAEMLGSAKVAAAGPVLVALAERLQDPSFYTAAGRCGGDATFTALTQAYGTTHRETVLEGIMAGPRDWLPWAIDQLASIPRERDGRFLAGIHRLATKADRPLLAEAALQARAPMPDLTHRTFLASLALSFGPPDPALWDLMIEGLRSEDREVRSRTASSAAHLELPSDRRAAVVELVRSARDREPDPSQRRALDGALQRLTPLRASTVTWGFPWRRPSR